MTLYSPLMQSEFEKAIKDPFASQPQMTGDHPYSGGFAITPADFDDLPKVTREILITGAGNISVVWLDGSATIEPVAATTRYRWRIKRVLATNTTATGIRGYY